MHTRIAVAVLAAAGLLVPAGAQAQDLKSFQTPSHNIFCIASAADPSSNSPAYIRCDLQAQTSKRPPRPKGCVDLDWGDSYTVELTGPGYLTCHGDTTADTSDAVLGYGQPWSAFGFSCTVAMTGLTCKNPGGHGFFMSKASSRAF